MIEAQRKRWGIGSGRVEGTEGDRDEKTKGTRGREKKTLSPSFLFSVLRH